MRWLWHRLMHRLQLEPCELLQVVDNGRLLVLRCTVCGERIELFYKGG